MDKRIHFFSEKTTLSPPAAPELLGIRGREVAEAAALGLPILPGFILDASLAARLERASLQGDLQTLLDRLGALLGKHYGDPENPLLFKIVISPNLALSRPPLLHNFGLVRAALGGFARQGGEPAGETRFLIRGLLELERGIAELEGKEPEAAALKEALQALDGASLRGIAAAEAAMERFAPLLPGGREGGVFEDPLEQLLLALGRASRLLALDDQNDQDTALLVQPLALGSGSCFTRNPATGEPELQGAYGPLGEDLAALAPRYRKELERIGRILEEQYRGIRRLHFVIENQKLSLLGHRPPEGSVLRGELRLLLDLFKRKALDAPGLVRAVEPQRLQELLHPGIDPGSVGGLKTWRGGMAGSPGAAVGRVCFSAQSLLAARKRALQQGQDSRFILALPASFAGDVQAIALAQGVLTAEGGTAAHASVVARQYGKPSLIAPELRFQRKRAFLGDLRFGEGEYLSLEALASGGAGVYQGEAALVPGNGAEAALGEIITLAKGLLRGFQVRANADTPEEAARALALGADGIGLCRTEHMFLKAGRLNRFRDLFLSATGAEREGALEELQGMQEEDFFRILKIMAGKEVVIRLLDAPLHEFLPHNQDELESYRAHLGERGGKAPSRGELRARIRALGEFNPMLGRRGCRLAVSYPEIYAMQVRALFSAASRLREEQVPVRPAVLVPLVMDAAELRLIAYGKKIEGAAYPGVAEVEEALRGEGRGNALPFRIGAMIEVPAAALGAGELAAYASFFSFGTNDLTQTTLGLSRDDFASFAGDYQRFDLMSADPFRALDPRVKELIRLAVARGRLTRPDLVFGLCGEHGANPAELGFCLEVGLDYVSCAPYAVPLAILSAAAQIQR